MYDDIIGSIDRTKEIKNRKFDLEPKKEQEEEFDLFEDLILEMEDEISPV